MSEFLFLCSTEILTRANPVLHTIQEHFWTDEAGGQTIPISLDPALIDSRRLLRLRPNKFHAILIGLMVSGSILECVADGCCKADLG